MLKMLAVGLIVLSLAGCTIVNLRWEVDKEHGKFTFGVAEITTSIDMPNPLAEKEEDDQ